MAKQNADPATIAGFGEEWTAFDQTALDDAKLRQLFERYFAIFPLDELGEAEGFDLGCRSGRWAALVALRVGLLHCIDPAGRALQVARRRLKAWANVHFHLATSGAIPLPPASQDFGYALGVLHHIPDTAAAMRDCVGYRMLWKASDAGRRLISRLSFAARRTVADAIAIAVYWTLVRLVRFVERARIEITHMPLGACRHSSFYTMRTDALDRFGTRLEQRFTQAEIRRMMSEAGLASVQFSNHPPYWVACAHKAPADALTQ